MSYMNKISMLDEMVNEMSHDILGAAFDLGKDKSGRTLQRRERDGWVDVIENGEVVKSPVDIDALPPGRYRLTKPIL